MRTAASDDDDDDDDDIVSVCMCLWMRWCAKVVERVCVTYTRRTCSVTAGTASPPSPAVRRSSTSVRARSSMPCDFSCVTGTRPHTIRRTHADVHCELDWMRWGRILRLWTLLFTDCCRSAGSLTAFLLLWATFRLWHPSGHVIKFIYTDLELLTRYHVTAVTSRNGWNQGDVRRDDCCRCCAHDQHLLSKTSSTNRLSTYIVVRIDRLRALSWFGGWWCMVVLSWWSDLSG